MSEADASGLQAAVAQLVDRLGHGRLVGLHRLSGGASQETYRVEVEPADDGGAPARFAMRRAPDGERFSDEVAGLATEAALLRLAAGAGVPVPAVLRSFEPDDGLGEGMLLEWLDGETIGSRIVRSDAFAAVRPGLARRCGEILARIHAIDPDRPELADLPRGDPAELVRATWDRYVAFDTPQPMIDFTGRWLLDHLPAPRPPALVHGDFRTGNLMIDPDAVDDQGGIVGVLDWELSHVGDPMRDLGWLCTASWRFGRDDLPVGGFGERDELFAGYESVTGRPGDRDVVRFWEVFGSFWWSVGCLAMVDHHRNGRDASVERVVIGRRSSECQVDCVNLLIPGPPPPPVGEEAARRDAPTLDEMLAAVADLLRSDELTAGAGERQRYLARVAANAVGIARREARLGPALRAAERAGLVAVLSAAGDGEVADTTLDALRELLAVGLRAGRIALDSPGLAGHLRATVIGQVGVDQPRYAGLATALRP